MDRRVKSILKQFIPRSIRDSYNQKRVEQLEKEYKAFHEKNQGSKYHCNFCQHSYDKLLPDGLDFEVIQTYQVLGAGPRDNAMCPYCQSKDRMRMLLAFLEQKTALFNTQANLLHIAPEPYLKAQFKKRITGTYVDGDLDPKLADEQIDITKIQYSEAYFDAIICFHVLEHVPTDIKAMQEFHRVLKNDGWAILQVPISMNHADTYEDPSITSEADREIHFGQWDHVRIYGHEDYENRLKKAGFKIQRIYPKDFLPQEEIIKLALNPEEYLIFCTKS